MSTTSPNLTTKGVLTVTLKKCTDLEVRRGVGLNAVGLDAVGLLCVVRTAV